MHNALLPCSVTRALLAYAYCDNNEGEHIADCLPLPNQDPSRMLGQDLQQPCTIYAQANYRTPLALVVAGEGEHVADSPYPIKILPGPSSARHSTVSGPGRYAATAGATADFSVQVKDASGNGYEMMEESAEGLLDLQVSVGYAIALCAANLIGMGLQDAIRSMACYTPSAGVLSCWMT
eukprot:GHUV01051923.1.p1 GENE.GHUV01051923.1~~GHUV01051923.1.p1  ORF type:complete len:179 (+),score=30.43 GHUV01051923.1:306-842(+)